jgi:hypothetical protein
MLDGTPIVDIKPYLSSVPSRVGAVPCGTVTTVSARAGPCAEPPVGNADASTSAVAAATTTRMERMIPSVGRPGRAAAAYPTGCLRMVRSFAGGTRRGSER